MAKLDAGSTADLAGWQNCCAARPPVGQPQPGAQTRRLHGRRATRMALRCLTPVPNDRLWRPRIGVIIDRMARSLGVMGSVRIAGGNS